MTLLKFDPARFVLNQAHFDHDSHVHGINHTYRVMCHVLLLGKSLQWERETRLAFCAAFIHDMSRKHDGYCTQHGLWSSHNKLPLFKEFFLSQGANLFELEEIAAAVKNHSEGFELSKDNRFHKTAFLLKDADALDRIRLGSGNLDPSYLRFEITESFIPFANKLYIRSNDKSLGGFSDIMTFADGLAEMLPGVEK